MSYKSLLAMALLQSALSPDFDSVDRAPEIGSIPDAVPEELPPAPPSLGPRKSRRERREEQRRAERKRK